MMAFERLEPFGALHEEMMAGSICAASLNPHRKEGAAPFGPADFMPSLARALRGEPEPEKPLPKLTPEQEAAWLDAAFFGGKVV
jgi:hypothetical protein